VSWKPIVGAIAAATFLAIHTILATLIIVSMYAVETLIKHLWGVENPLMFGFLPVAYIFQGIDLGVLSCRK
jgi:hypothetical protein